MQVHVFRWLYLGFGVVNNDRPYIYIYDLSYQEHVYSYWYSYFFRELLFVHKSSDTLF
jgi:hypothetical protein